LNERRFLVIETQEQRRRWFATHPEYSWSHRGISGRPEKEKDENEIDPRDVDEYVDNALKYETDQSVMALLESVKLNFGTQAYPSEHDEFGDNSGMDWWSRQPDAWIGPPPPPDLSDRARQVVDILFPGITKAYDRWRIGYYDAYPWAPGPVYDALPDLIGLAAAGLTKIQVVLAKAINPAEIAALQRARQELLKIWEYANFPRGRAIEDHLGRNLPRTFKGIDQFDKGVATSIKSMDLRLKSYQDPAKILSQGRKYVDQVANFEGAIMRDFDIAAKDITERALRLGVPHGATKAQKSALKSLIEYGKQNGVKVEVITVP